MTRFIALSKKKKKECTIKNRTRHFGTHEEERINGEFKTLIT